MIECIPFKLDDVESIEDIPQVGKTIFCHFMEGDSMEDLAEEYKVNVDFIEEVIREISNKVGANMVVEVLLNG